MTALSIFLVLPISLQSASSVFANEGVKNTASRENKPLRGKLMPGQLYGILGTCQELLKDAGWQGGLTTPTKTNESAPLAEIPAHWSHLNTQNDLEGRVLAGLLGLQEVYRLFYPAQGKPYLQFPTSILRSMRNLMTLHYLAGDTGTYIPSDVSTLITARENEYRTQVELLQKIRYLGILRVKDYTPLSFQVFQSVFDNAQNETRVTPGSPFLAVPLNAYNNHTQQYTLIWDHDKALDNLYTELLVHLVGLVQKGNISAQNPLIKEVVDDILANQFSRSLRPLTEKTVWTLYAMLNNNSPPPLDKESEEDLPETESLLDRFFSWLKKNAGTTPTPTLDALQKSEAGIRHKQYTKFCEDLRQHPVLTSALDKAQSEKLAKMKTNHEVHAGSLLEKAENFTVNEPGIRQVVSCMEDLFQYDGYPFTEEYSLWRRLGFVNLSDLITLREIGQVHVINEGRFHHSETNATYAISGDPIRFIESLPDEIREENLAAQFTRRGLVAFTQRAWQLYGIKREIRHLSLVAGAEIFDQIAQDAGSLGAEAVQFFEKRLIPGRLKKLAPYQLWEHFKLWRESRKQEKEKQRPRPEDLAGKRRDLNDHKELGPALASLYLEFDFGQSARVKEILALPPASPSSPASDGTVGSTPIPATSVSFPVKYQTAIDPNTKEIDFLRLLLTNFDQEANRISVSLNSLKRNALLGGKVIATDKSLRAAYDRLEMDRVRLLNNVSALWKKMSSCFFDVDKDAPNRSDVVARNDARQTLAAEIWGGDGYPHLIRFLFAHADYTSGLVDIPLRLFVMALEEWVRESEVRFPNIQPPDQTYFQADQGRRLEKSRLKAWAAASFTGIVLLVGGGTTIYIERHELLDFFRHLTSGSAVTGSEQSPADSPVENFNHPIKNTLPANQPEEPRKTDEEGS